ncbi:MAG: UDP-N-acetylmuramoyl-L-alanyl-D-glutamate--2,6-diaminopimelate ligase [Eubacteriales bacterium]
MKLKELLKGVKVITSCADTDTEISKVVSDSRKSVKDCVFVAICGGKRDGNDYACEAIKKGAAAIVSEKNITGIKNLVVVENARSALAIMQSNYYGNPAKDMRVIAVTGTNGKTSVSYFIYNILTTAEKRCGLISTVETLINGEKMDFGGGGAVTDISSAMTTPDPETLYKILDVMRKEGCEYVVMEASSHSLSQHRLDGLHVNIAIFTNLSPEHLDFHGDMENYFASKLMLFENCDTSIVNTDDEYGKRIAKKYKEKTHTCSLTEKSDYRAEQIKCGSEGCEYLLLSEDATLRINSVICGEYTVYNTMLAAVCALYLDIDAAFICEGIRFTNKISGRMEKYKNYNIYIDYAHTPGAMENVIKSVRNFAGGKKITVLFGCGGDRDKTKRAVMGRISTSLADNTIITSDNPRTEDPYKIIGDILTGVVKGKEHVVIPDRKEAIKYAVKTMKKDEILLLLGKGHENYEITKNGKTGFDEREIIAEALGEK